MADDDLPKPEPKEIDEKLALQLKHLAEDNVLKGKPYGDEKCGNCLYYLNPDDKHRVLLAPEAAHPRRRRVVVSVVGEDRGV